MPPLTRWFLKTAIVCLLAALLLSLLLALNPMVELPLFVSYLSPVYFHLFLVGWVTQMIFGVIYWMFPIITRAKPRGNAYLGWTTYLLLNVGLLLRVIGEPLVGIFPQSGWGRLLPLSAFMQWLAGVLFIWLAWPRVKARYRGG